MNLFKKNKKQVGIFVTAGFPKIDSLGEQLLYLQEKGVDFIEIGIPFSDPMADGPMIQKSSEIALKNGMNMELLFEQIAQHREEITVPIVLMGYFNPVLHFGLERFLQKCTELKISGLIFPDLSFEILETKYKQITSKFEIPFIFLVTPSTSNERILTIANASHSSFVYLVGQNSTTGNDFILSTDLQKRYKEITSLCNPIPVFLGFGIDSYEKKAIGFQQCDGVIIGSAYLKALQENLQESFLLETMQI